MADFFFSLKRSHFVSLSQQTCAFDLRDLLAFIGSLPVFFFFSTEP